jgi:hypothetical protein
MRHVTKRKGLLFLPVVALLGMLGCSDSDQPTAPQPAEAVLRGTFTISGIDVVVQGDGFFSRALFIPVEFSVTFKGFETRVVEDEPGQLVVYVTTTPVTVAFAPGQPADCLEMVERSLQGASMEFELVEIMDHRIHVSGWVSGTPGTEYFQFAFTALYTGSVTPDGAPVFEDFPTVSGTVSMHRFTDAGGFEMTDAVNGTLATTLHDVSAIR